jgi:putative hemolysin
MMQHECHKAVTGTKNITANLRQSSYATGASMQHADRRSGFLFVRHASLGAIPRASNAFHGAIERMFALHSLENLYRSMPPTGNADQFVDRVLSALAVKADIAAEEISRIPRKGPAIIIANHPFGAVEGLVLAQLLRKIRPDVKLLVNKMLDRIPELSELFIPVDAFGGKGAAARNVAPMRNALKWVRSGGMLLVFPAGTVSHLTLSRGCVTDPPWHSAVGRLARLAQAPVTPVYIHGSNSAMFQIAGLLHPRLRTALLPRELLKRSNTTLRARVGQPLQAAHIAATQSDEEAIQYLRVNTYLLAEAAKPGTAPPAMSAPPVPLRKTAPQPLIAEVTPGLLAAEIAALPASQCLAQSRALAVYCAQAAQIPWCLQEIGRLREKTFRAAGEGTGRASDIDLYDAYYQHLFVWDADSRMIVGGYRMGLSDQILRQFGKRGLYTYSLFHMSSRLIDIFNPAIELGRSFIRAEYQREFSPLLLLWRGIGTYVAQNPRYRLLFGPVSISNDYTPLSRQLMMEFLNQHLQETRLARHVRPRRRLRVTRSAALDGNSLRCLHNVDTVSQLVARIEDDGKGMPVLIRQYLKLGGRLLGFSTDSQFGETLDGLIMVDLRHTDPKLLARYMGESGTSAFLAYHGASSNDSAHTLRKAS